MLQSIHQEATLLPDFMGRKSEPSKTKPVSFRPNDDSLVARLKAAQEKSELSAGELARLCVHENLEAVVEAYLRKQQQRLTELLGNHAHIKSGPRTKK